MTTGPWQAALLAIGLCATAVAAVQPGVGDRPCFNVRGTVVDAEGQPAGGAEVVLINARHDSPVDWEHPKRHRRAVLTTADPNGDFVLADVPAGTYWLWAGNARGQAHIRRIGFEDEAPPPALLRLSDTVLDGEVLWDDGATPVALAEVSVYSRNQPLFTMTGGAGRFRIPGITAGQHNVLMTTRVPMTETQRQCVNESEQAGHGSSRDDLTRWIEEVRIESIVTVEPDRTTSLRLVVPGGVVDGFVTTPDGKSVAGARVYGGGRTTFTAWDGRFTLTHVPVGPCEVVAHERKRNWYRRVPVEVEPGDRPELIEITLYPFRPEVVFHFTDAEGMPVADRYLRLTYGTASGMSGCGGTRTDGDGLWRTSWMDSGTMRYLFGWPTIGWAEMTVVVEEAMPETHCHVRLIPGAAVTGTVRERGSGDPIGGVRVHPTRVGPDGEYGQTSLWNGLSCGFHTRLVSGYPITQISRDGDGTYRLSNLPPGDYKIVGRRLSITDQKDIEGFDLEVDEMPEKRWVSGRVLAPAGEPLAGAEVTVIMDVQGPGDGWGPMGSIPRRVLTDEAGRFRLGPFHRREYWLTAQIPGQSSGVTRVDLTADSIDAGDFTLAESEYATAAEP